MDNHWEMSKCGSTWQSSTEPPVVATPSPVSQLQLQDSSRNSMINSSHYSYPHTVQEPCSSIRKLMADPLLQTPNFNLYNSSLSVTGTPFFTLLSGSPSFLQYDSQQVLNSKPSNSSTKVHVYDPSLELAKAVNYHTSHGLQHLNGFSSVKAAPVSGPPSTQSGKQLSHQLSPLTSGLPRVFCLYASGDLFLSKTGLLGVVCSCHGFHMSVSQFSEHAGLRDVNPGDAVHMDSGETIAQWRKLYFSKFGIRIPGDQCGWHWPEGFSTGADLVKSSERVPNVTKIDDLSNSVGPSRPFAASRQRQPSLYPGDNPTNQNFVHAHDNNCKLPIGFTEASLSNPPGGVTNRIIKQQPVSRSLSNSKLAGGTDNTFKSDPIYKTKSSFISQQSLQNTRTLGKNSDKLNGSWDGSIMERTRISSNIELRLGQPSQQSQAFGKSNVAIFNVGSNRIAEESKQIVNCAAEVAKSSSTEGQNRMAFSNLGFAAYSTRMAPQPEQLKDDVVAGSVNSILFSNLESCKDKIQTKDSHSNADNHHVMPKQQYVQSQISKLGSMNFGYNAGTSSKVKFSFSKTNLDQNSHVQIPSNAPVDVSKARLALNHSEKIFSPGNVGHGFSRPVALRSGAPSMVLSSIVMSTSPNITSTMTREAATQVLKYSKRDDVSSSSCGFDKVQSVLSNPLDKDLRNSIEIPSKSTERRDGYKVASNYNLPQLATKSLHSGTTSWTVGATEKSAAISVSPGTSFQIGKSRVQSNLLRDPYQADPPLPSIGINEDICSSSGHGNCCHGTSCACRCSVQKTNMIENSNLEGKFFVSAFGEPSQTGATILSACNIDKDCTLLNTSISFGKVGETMKPNLKKVEFNAFQWKDVPSKSAKFLEERSDVNDQTSDVTRKCFDQPARKADYMKEQVMSNISSKCSAPALTQASVKISNGYSCTDDAQNTDCAKNWSSDDSGSNTGFDGYSCKTNSKNETRSKAVPDRSTRSLVDELRVIDSLRLKKVQNQVHLPENSSSVKPFEKDIKLGKRKREKKFKILGTSFPASPVSSISTGSSGQSSQSLDDELKLDKRTKGLPCKTPRRVYDDYLEITESSRGKKGRLELEFSKTKPVWIQDVPCKRYTRPVVCGKYGLISNGDTSKPAKIFSLKKILKTAKRCSPAEDEFVKKSPAKTLKKSITREANRRSGRIANINEDKCYIGQRAAVFSDDDPLETSDSDFGTTTRRKSKEIRKRSLYELITEGKDSGFATVSKNPSSIPQNYLKDGGNITNLHEVENISRSPEELTCKSTPDMDMFCNVCGSLNNDEMNRLLECNRCLIKVHQACYGISKIPKSYWHCRPCRENATNIVCVLCGYDGGVMTRALQSSSIVRSLLNAWNVARESQENHVEIDAQPNSISEPTVLSSAADKMVKNSSYSFNDRMILNSVTVGVLDSTVKQWVHMVCGLWTPGTRCPNVDTMSAFDVSGACYPKGNVVCSICKRPGGCCIRCRVMDCVIHFHPWCAHQKGLLQSEVEGADNEKVGFYGRCELHATGDYCNHKTNSRSIQVASPHEKETCARTEGYKGRKREGFRHDSRQNSNGAAGGCLVRQEHVDAWNHINRLLLFKRRLQKTPQPVQDVESDVRKEYTRYKQSQGWKHLVVYKSGIHALGLYTSLFISQSAMVVEYVGEIVGLRVADRRESEYQSGKQLQYKSACYFFRIDKEHIIDATRKGGIARFVNHSCEPNCVAKVITVRGEKKVVFFAERDIYPGEEITYDYHFNNEDEGKKILCSCNSSNCRRYLN